MVRLSNGEPLIAGQIVFHPTGEVSQPARGVVGADGSFKLGTSKPGDGAVAGTYKVILIPGIPAEANDDPKLIERYASAIDLRYQSARTTPLELTVKDDGSKNHFEIELETPRGRRS